MTAIAMSIQLLLLTASSGPASMPAATRPTTQPTDAQRQFVRRVLSGLQSGRDDVSAISVALAAGGKEALAALEELRDKPELLITAEEAASPSLKEMGELGVAELRRMRLEAVDEAVSQLQWGINGREKVQQWIASQTGGAGMQRMPGRLTRVCDQAVREALPDRLMYTLVMRQFPVAVMPPEPLAAQNLFAVDAQGKVAHITSPTGLQEFLRVRMPAVMNEAAARRAIFTWLRLVQEFIQDGMLRFSIPADGIQVVKGQGIEALTATGKAVVEARRGDAGQITGTLVFDAEGHLVSARHEPQITSGIRPICQATKLLDADPIVRRMAEQDLRVMGSAAADYLRQQRAEASPELREAIDRIWREIVRREGRDD